MREGTIVGLANHTILIARDGTERPIDDSAAPMRDEAGAALGAVLVFRDVTERKRAEEARARLAAIVESSEDAIVSKTLDGVIRSWNAGAERLFGYTAEEAVGQPITLIIPPERQDEERAILERLRRGERVEHFETVRVAKDGRRLDISLTVSPLRDDDGPRSSGRRRSPATSPSGSGPRTPCGRARSATGGRRPRRPQAAEANAKFRAFFEQGTNFAGVLALDGTVVEANRLCLDACGFTRDEVIGKPFWECGWWNRSAALMDMVRAASPPGGRRAAVPHGDPLLRGRRRRAGGGPHPRPRDRRGGPRPVRGRHRDRHHRPAADGGRAAGAGPAQGRVPRAAGPRAAEPAGPAPQRPAGDAARRPATPSAVAQARAMMERQLGHMVRLIDDLLDVSRINRNKMELRRSRVLLADVVSSAVETARPLIEAAGHELTVSLPPEPVFLDADLTRLAQVFGNLLTNSAKYTEPGGHIWLAAERRGDGRRRLRPRQRDRHPGRVAAAASSTCSPRWTGASSGPPAGSASGWRW